MFFGALRLVEPVINLYARIETNLNNKSLLATHQEAMQSVKNYDKNFDINPCI